MNIALIAHDAKKELMIQFCIAYSGMLRKHNLCATGMTARAVSEVTGLKIHPYLCGSQGGTEQISAMISCGEIDVLLFFRDPISPKANEPKDTAILRLCDMHLIPVATNIATAEPLILAIERGDLSYRETGKVVL